MNRKGFTLIELLAVIVILAIIALIATPIILNIISDSKENARERTIDNIVHAVELEYAKNQISKGDVDYVAFDLSDENNGLEFSGERPEGNIYVYNDGRIYLNIKFEDGTTYIKLPNNDNQEIQSSDKVIGSSILWDTDGNGTIKGFKTLPQYVDIYIFRDYVIGAYQFATFSRVDANGNKVPNADKTIYELESKIIKPQFNRTFLMNEKLREEIDVLLELFNVKEQLTDEEVNKLLENNKSKLPYTIELIELYKRDGEINNTNYLELKIVDFLNSSMDNSFLIIPNYVMHDDGSLEKITAIGDFAFLHKEWVENTFYAVSTINNALLGKKLTDKAYDYTQLENKKGINLIISEGIENIGDSAFGVSILNSLTLPNTLKEIGVGSFDLVYHLNNIILPDSLESIGDSAFIASGIKGELVIPSNIKYIGDSAFFRIENFNDNEYNLIKYNNDIESIVFKPNSKIETIEAEAFKGNNVKELILPSSIKNIGKEAFNMSTLKNVIIKKAEGVDLTLGENAFGTANVTYEE